MRVYFSWNNWIPPILSGKIYNLSFFPPYVKIPLFGKSLGKEKKKKKKKGQDDSKINPSRTWVNEACNCKSKL